MAAQHAVHEAPYLSFLRHVDLLSLELCPARGECLRQGLEFRRGSMRGYHGRALAIEGLADGTTQHPGATRHDDCLTGEPTSHWNLHEPGCRHSRPRPMGHFERQALFSTAQI